MREVIPHCAAIIKERFEVCAKARASRRYAKLRFAVEVIADGSGALSFSSRVAGRIGAYESCGSHVRARPDPL